MGKNNKLINSLNEIARRNRSQNVATAADQMVPQIYAAIAIALHRTYGFGYKRINDIFVESQHIGRIMPETELAWLKSVRKKPE